VLLERVRDCFPNCLRVAMEERPKVDICRKSLEFSLIVCPLQSRPRFQFLIMQFRRIAILHVIDRKVCSTEKRVCLFMHNGRNDETVDTDRSCLTSQIFGLVDFTKHRPGMRRLHLRQCGKSWQYSHGSIFTPSTPKLEHVSLTHCKLDAISETIEESPSN